MATKFFKKNQRGAPALASQLCSVAEIQSLMCWMAGGWRPIYEFFPGAMAVTGQRCALQIGCTVDSQQHGRGRLKTIFGNEGRLGVVAMTRA